MISITVDVGSAWRGIKALSWPYAEHRPGWTVRWARGLWVHLWTPAWHQGRGPYLSLGLGVLAIYRGY